METQIVVPNLMEFDNYREFLKTFFKTNSEKSYFSSRYLARKLEWPHSLLHDIIGNRKDLSLARAIVLSGFLRLDYKSTEYLISLVLKENKNKHLADYGLLKMSRILDQTAVSL